MGNRCPCEKQKEKSVMKFNKAVAAEYYYYYYFGKEVAVLL